MTQDNRREQLSSMMDNELDEFSVQKLLREAEQDPSVLAHWAELHRSDAARHGMPDVDVLAGVNAALDASEQESAESEQQRRLMWQHERRGMVWGALAASLVVSLVAVFWIAPNGDGGSPILVTESVQEPLADPVVLAQLQNYWAVHTQYSTYQPGARWDEVGSSSPGAL
ncbi:hypothetical protein NFC81_03660 [Salinispirillum sp. LH 10-3-1]|uniref:Anti sigma-E protein RseA N-terminal domain-containing protein n=1 Tax=Salinispirillum sp. LH 10-3-1 TaxID=2952525 RepID=A0AB38YHN8_9GAMM